MTFLERYNHETAWYSKVTVMEIYHLTASHRHKSWTLQQTAQYFNVSIGLVSENLKLAQAFHKYENLYKQPTRQDALKWLKHRNGWRE